MKAVAPRFAEPVDMDDSKAVFRILLAEDLKLNQMLTQKLLARSGYQMDVVDNGHQAVEAVRAKDYDVVLMDVIMPGLDGLEATKQIRALPAPKNAVPIIALTGTTMHDAEAFFRAAGMDDYISKPINFDILFTKLSTLAAQRLKQASTASDSSPQTRSSVPTADKAAW